MTVDEMKQNARRCIKMAKQCASVKNASTLYETADYWIGAAAALEKDRERAERNAYPDVA